MSPSSLLSPAKNSQPFATDTLLIFLDNSEKQFGAISSGLFLALEQKASPILTTGHLVRLLTEMPSLYDLVKGTYIMSPVTHQEYHTLTHYYESVIDKLASNAQTLTDLAEKKKIVDDLTQLRCQYNLEFLHTDKRARAALLKTASTFNPDEWLIKEVNADLLLLIPKAHIANIQQKIDSTAPAHENFTGLELALGMQVDHMRTINSLVEYSRLYKGYSGYIDLAGAFDKIFIQRAEYAKISLSGPTWAFYLDGHGNLGESIANISLEGFKCLLDFLEAKISTKLLIYSSCYAAGTNAEIIYTDQKSNRKIYSFTIVTEALTDAEVTVELPFVGTWFYLENIDFEKKRIKIIQHRDFNSFVNQITTLETLDFEKLLANVMPEAECLVSASAIGNLPQIKLPWSPYFKVMDGCDNIVSIDSTWALSGEKELNIVSSSKPHPLGILLYTNYIPCTLKINMKSMPKIVPMAVTVNVDPNNDTPYVVNPIFEIEGIETKVSFENFLDAFDVVKKGGSKTFRINSLIIENKPGFPELLQDVIIEHNEPKGNFRIYRIISKDRPPSHREYYNFKNGRWNLSADDSGDYVYNRVATDATLQEAREKVKQAHEEIANRSWHIKLKIHMVNAMTKGLAAANILHKTFFRKTTALPA